MKSWLLKFCDSCKEPTTAGRFCFSCGSEQLTNAVVFELKRCTKCGFITPKKKYCVKCGANLEYKNVNNEQ